MNKPIYALSFSITLWFFLCFGYGGALASLSLVSLSSKAMALIPTAIILHFVIMLKRHLLFESGVSHFFLDKNAIWKLFVSGNGFSAVLLPNSILSSHLMILNFQQLGPKGPRLFPDNISPTREAHVDGDPREAFHSSPSESPSILTLPQAGEIAFFKSLGSRRLFTAIVCLDSLHPEQRSQLCWDMLRVAGKQA